METIEEVKEPIRELLKEELAKKCLKNPTYSLRAFAKYLEISPSYLSALLNGKRKLAPALRKEVLNKLNLNVTDVVSLEVNHQENYNMINAEVFNAIADWYHYAILELCYLKDFEFTPDNIATELNLSIHVVRQAISRLMKLDLLIYEDGKWIDNTELMSVYEENQTSKAAALKYQLQIMDKSKEALEELPKSVRSHTSTMMSFKKENLDRAKQLINKFRKDFTELMMDAESADAIYQLQVSLFPITKDKK